LEVMQSAPPGCFLQAVTSGDTEPHLHCGEFAIVDTADREPIIGELYVIEHNSPLSSSGKRRRIVQVGRFAGSTLQDGSPALFVGSYARDQHIPGIGAVRMIDGAFSADDLRSQLIGRVIGVLG
jgi:hypothetical protein